MATTTNYTTNGVSRKVDLYVMGAFNFNSQSTQPLAPTLGAESGGQVCAGVVKVAQKIVSYLLTLAIPYDDGWGTAITASLVYSNQYQIQQLFPTVMISAISDMVKNLTAQETDTTPLDERISQVSMEDWSLDGHNGILKVSLSLRVQSGLTTNIVVPISIVP